MDSRKAQIADHSQWSVLMARAQDGDATAYRQLLADIAPYLRARVARHHRDLRDIEDTVQDVLLTVHAIRHTYDPKRPFAPWLVAIANRRIIDRLRSQGRQYAKETALAEEHETFSVSGTNLYEAASEGRALRKAVAGLPAGQREAVTLLKLKGLSLKEAAAKSGQSEAALKVAVHRAVKRLKTLMQGS